MNKEKSPESALLEPGLAYNGQVNKERMLKYKLFAQAFSYPDEKFFAFFPEYSSQKDRLRSEYDRYFRKDGIWLYGAEYIAKNEFQRAACLSDINGFYRAFGVRPENERPDYLAHELEFMHYLIFKEMRAFETDSLENTREKAFICFDAQVKFFNAHLWPAAGKLVNAVITKAKTSSYAAMAAEMLEFLKSEKTFLKEDR